MAYMCTAGICLAGLGTIVKMVSRLTRHSVFRQPLDKLNEVIQGYAKPAAAPAPAPTQ
jgi:hypothetical protein